MEEAGREGEGMVFKDRDAAVMAYRNGYVHLHSRKLVSQQTASTSLGQKSKKHKVLAYNSW